MRAERMQKVVVTGGAGFIGSHLVEELAKRGNRVIVLDDLSTGKLENLAHMLSPTTQQTQQTQGTQATQFVEGSITDLPLLQELFQGVDYVFHQAAISSIPRSIEDPQASHQANVTGTMNVLLAAKANGVKEVVYASSCAIYGDTQIIPTSETAPPDPLSPYAVTKLAGEYYCRVFHRVYGLATACLRYFNVYGPRQDPNSQYAAVIPRFISSVLDGTPFTIYGDGGQTRDFVYVKDVVEANILAAESGATGVFNIAGGEKVSVNQLAKLIAELAGSNTIEPVHKAPRPGDVVHSLADISRARKFGYKPGYILEQGLLETTHSMRRE